MCDGTVEDLEDELMFANDTIDDLRDDNARLRAEKAELLAVCETALTWGEGYLTWLQDEQGYEEELTHAWHHWQQMIDEVIVWRKNTKAVIAKAKGQGNLTMAIKRITVLQSNHHRPLAVGEKVPDIARVEADVRGDYAVFYDDWHEHWSVTHVPTGASICRAPTKKAAMAVMRTLQPLRLSCTYDDENGFQWPDQKAEVELVKDVLRQFEWYRKLEED